jgi:hypothetical protein
VRRAVQTHGVAGLELQHDQRKAPALPKIARAHEHAIAEILGPRERPGVGAVAQEARLPTAVRHIGNTVGRFGDKNAVSPPATVCKSHGSSSAQAISWVGPTWDVLPVLLVGVMYLRQFVKATVHGNSTVSSRTTGRPATRERRAVAGLITMPPHAPSTGRRSVMTRGTLMTMSSLSADADTSGVGPESAATCRTAPHAAGEYDQVCLVGVRGNRSNPRRQFVSGRNGVGFPLHLSLAIVILKRAHPRLRVTWVC